MSTYFNHLPSALYETTYSFKESLFSSSTPLQKKILFITTAIFSLLVTLILIHRICFKVQNKNIIQLDNDPSTKSLLKGSKKILENNSPKASLIGNDSANKIPPNLANIKPHTILSGTSSTKEIVEMAKKAGEALIELQFNSFSFSLEEHITTDQLEEVLKACPNLKRLELSYSSKLTENVIKKLPRNLEQLYLPNWNLTNDVIKDLPPNLQILRLSCFQLTEDGIKVLPEKLHTLEMMNCVNLSNNAILYLPKKLQKLGLYHYYKLKDLDIKNIPRQLTKLTLDECTLMNDSIKDLPPVKTLKLIACPLLTDAAIKNLPLRNLQMLDISGCHIKVSATKDLPRFIKINTNYGVYKRSVQELHTSIVRKI